MGLEPGRYLLYVSRLEPENNALLTVQAYARVETDVPLVLVGDAPYAQDYIREVKAAADDRVRFLGYRFGDDYHALQANALAYIQATEVGRDASRAPRGARPWKRDPRPGRASASRGRRRCRPVFQPSRRG